MNPELLDKLNAYLISKGKPPKKLNQNFLKSNVKKISLSGKPETIQKRKNSNSLHVQSKNKSSKKLCDVTLSRTSKTFSQKENVLKVVKNSASTKPINPEYVSPTKCLSATENISTKSSKEKKVEVKLAEAARKKLLRRSMNSGYRNSRHSSLSQPLQGNAVSTPKLEKRRKLTICTEKIPRKKVYLPEKNCKTPKQRRAASDEQRQQRLEQLRLWMIAKGKDPSKLCGFKAARAVLTPVGSPANQISTPSKDCSQWPTLQQEDFCEEMSFLVNQAMKEALSCLEKDCLPLEIYTQLMTFKEKVPVAVKHASFWITLSHVYQKLRKSRNEILEVFKNAIQYKAKPETDIKAALKNFVETNVTEPSNESFPSVTTESTNVLEAKLNDDAVTSPERPLPFSAFNSKEFPMSPLAAVESPSSIVRFRMVPKSSPIFKKLVSRKAFPSHVNAIVTPVRRSKRIENIKWSYPKGLVCKETCVSNPSDLIKTLQSSQEKTSDFVYEPNKALGDEFSDIQKILRFE